MERNDTTGGENMRLLTKAESCWELKLSLSTLNRYIAAGDVPVRREPRGRRHQLYVMLDEEPQSAAEAPQSDLPAALHSRSPWWRFWQL